MKRDMLLYDMKNFNKRLQSDRNNAIFSILLSKTVEKLNNSVIDNKIRYMKKKDEIAEIK